MLKRREFLTALTAATRTPSLISAQQSSSKANHKRIIEPASSAFYTVVPTISRHWSSGIATTSA